MARRASMTPARSCGPCCRWCLRAMRHRFGCLSLRHPHRVRHDHVGTEGRPPVGGHLGARPGSGRLSLAGYQHRARPFRWSPFHRMVHAVGRPTARAARSARCSLPATRSGSATREPGGVSRIADGKVQHYGSAEGLPAGLVATLLEDSAGQIWAGTREGLSTFANNRWSRPAGGLPPGPVHSAHPAADGTLLVGTGAGLFSRAPDDQEFRQIGRHRKHRAACHRRSFEPHVDHRSHQRLPRGR